MNRDIIRHSEGYWSLVDDFGKEMCRFKIGDNVKLNRVETVFPPKIEGKIKGVSFRAIFTLPVKRYTTIEIEGIEYFSFSQNISDILSMEVIQ